MSEVLPTSPPETPCPLCRGRRVVRTGGGGIDREGNVVRFAPRQAACPFCEDGTEASYKTLMRTLMGDGTAHRHALLVSPAALERLRELLP